MPLDCSLQVLVHSILAAVDQPGCLNIFTWFKLIHFLRRISGDHGLLL